MNTKCMKIAEGDYFSLERGPISTTQLVQYAGASGDFNRIHFDYPFVKENGMDGLLVHGMLTMGVAVAVIAEYLGPRAFIKEVSSRFTAPVRVGDTVKAEATVMTRTETSVCMSITAKVNGQRVLTGEATILLPIEDSRNAV